MRYRVRQRAHYQLLPYTKVGRWILFPQGESRWSLLHEGTAEWYYKSKFWSGPIHEVEPAVDSAIDAWTGDAARMESCQASYRNR